MSHAIGLDTDWSIPCLPCVADKQYRPEWQVVEGELRERVDEENYLTLCHFHKPISRQRERIADRFKALVKEWSEDTQFSSSIEDMVQHEAYQEIIDQGYEVLPLLLHKLEEEPNHWFIALQKITGTNPVPSEFQGRVDKMAEVWLAWGHQRDLI